MPDYRHFRIPGETYFFTVALQDRCSVLLVNRIEVLREAARTVQARLPFHIDAWVVLPDHLHCVWTLPPGDADHQRRWRIIKGAFSRGLPAGAAAAAADPGLDEHRIWQRRYWEHAIRDEHDYVAHMDYTHFNPVKHGLAQRVADWPFSSFQRCVTQGLYPRDWLGGGAEPEAGEPA